MNYKNLQTHLKGLRKGDTVNLITIGNRDGFANWYLKMCDENIDFKVVDIKYNVVIINITDFLEKEFGGRDKISDYFQWNEIGGVFGIYSEMPQNRVRKKSVVKNI